jgi:hypothetical protein
MGNGRQKNRPQNKLKNKNINTNVISARLKSNAREGHSSLKRYECNSA